MIVKQLMQFAFQRHFQLIVSCIFHFFVHCLETENWSVYTVSTTMLHDAHLKNWYRFLEHLSNLTASFTKVEISSRIACL